MTRYILQIHCPDQKGLIAGTTQVLAKAGANIIDLQQHTAKDIETFFLRAVFDIEADGIPEVKRHLETIAPHLQLNWKLFDTTKTERVAIFVSKTDHCLYELLLKRRDGDLPCEFSCIVGNHPDLGPVGGTFGVPFYYVPSNPDKTIPENRFREIIKETNTDTIVLARYMQILSEAFTKNSSTASSTSTTGSSRHSREPSPTTRHGARVLRSSVPPPTLQQKTSTKVLSFVKIFCACPKPQASMNLSNSARTSKSVRFRKPSNFGLNTAYSFTQAERSSSRSHQCPKNSRTTKPSKSRPAPSRAKLRPRTHRLPMLFLEQKKSSIR